MALSCPEPLHDLHSFANFDCGTPSLNTWLLRRSRANHNSGASRTYVVCHDACVIGFYCLASGAIALKEAPKSLQRNMPDPLPVAVLGRLAVTLSWQGHGLGVALLQDAVLRTIEASQIIGIKGLMVHALDEKAKLFYQKHGFVECPNQPMTLAISVKSALSG